MPGLSWVVENDDDFSAYIAFSTTARSAVSTATASTVTRIHFDIEG
jgi:hypothetical protein